MRIVSLSPLVFLALPLSAQPRLPIIDMHLHAVAADANGPPPLALCVPISAFPVHDPRASWGETFIQWQKKPLCASPVWSPMTDEALMNETIAVLKRRNVIGVLSGTVSRVQTWKRAAPDHLIAGLQFQLGRESFSPDSLQRLHENGMFMVLAEVSNQYVGISPSDSVFEPYLAVAEQRDIPVGIHIGTGPPGAAHLGLPRYRAALHSPLTLEDALVRHPKMRVYIMHAGWPMLDDLLAVMWVHPHVYAELGGIIFGVPRAELYRYLQRIVEAGFGKRVMFGSD
ncbi:MAG: amidohydrolase family protein, partial [Gemmatimonadaceae bacterium]